MFQQKALLNEMARLHKFALRLTKNAHNAEDLLQNTVLRALEKKEYFQEGTNLFSWTSKMMFNLFVTSYRRKSKFETQYDPEPHIAALSVAPTQENHMDWLTVNKKMQSLSPEHREILTLICVHDMRYDEASTLLGIPLGTVRSRLSRARQQLQVMLEPLASYTAPALSHVQAMAA